MAATYVTMAELRSNLGIGSLYSDSDVEACCQAAEDQINAFLWFDSAPVVGTSLASNVASVVLANPGLFTVGETVTIAGAGSTFNGSYTVTGTIPWSTGSTFGINTYMYGWLNQRYPNGLSIIQYAKTASNQNFRRVMPSGTAVGTDTKTQAYSATSSVREAAMILAVDIWQARQAPSGGQTTDVFSPSPFKMGNAMIGKIRGLLAAYMNPSSMVG